MTEDQKAARNAWWQEAAKARKLEIECYERAKEIEALCKHENKIESEGFGSRYILCPDCGYEVGW